jgi:hypothetical protein
MKTIFGGILMATVSLVMSPSASQAQTVRDTSNGQESLEREVKALCGSTAHVIVGSDHAYVYLSGEYLQNRNLNEVARNLALDGLNAFPESSTFSVSIKDSKGRGYAVVRH